MLTAGLVVLHAEYFTKCSVARWMFNIVYFLYCSIHCTFYCWAIKWTKTWIKLSASFILMKTRIEVPKKQSWQALDLFYCRWRLDIIPFSLLCNKALPTAAHPLMQPAGIFSLCTRAAVSQVTSVFWETDVSSIICLQACCTAEVRLNVLWALLTECRSV